MMRFLFRGLVASCVIFGFLLQLTFSPFAQASLPLAFSLSRGLDPVVITGDHLFDWDSVSLDHLFLYAYRQSSDTWEQIPWQFDEKHAGVYVSAEDGELDADDELAFMARDCGDQAQASQWIADANARGHKRYEITVTDPLHAGERCWVYLYRSTTLHKTIARDYVSYGDHTAASDVYRLTLEAHKLIAADLTFFDSAADILDRTKVRRRIGSISLTEDEDALVGDDPRSDWYGIRDGNVRTITQFVSYDADTGQEYLFLTLLNYRDVFQEHVTYDLSSVVPTLDEFRYSADLTSAMAGGTYYDANTASGVPVDGHADAVAATPFSPWNQVSHPTLGTIVQIIDPASLGGTQKTYYKDDGSYDNADTGDHRSYADHGMLVLGGSANLDFYVWYYVLSAGQPNVGATYANAAMHPLRAQTVSQERAEATATPTPPLTLTPLPTPTATTTPTPTPVILYLPIVMDD